MGIGVHLLMLAQKILQITPRCSEELIQAYFDSTQGNGYRLGVSIHSCDFS